MKNNIILQHFDGILPDWAEIATKTVSKYAFEIGVNYELVTGMPLGKEHGPYAQKMIMFDEKYDKYDQVLMIDMDVAATNVFDDVFDVPQIGVLHSRAMISASKASNGWENNPLYKQGEYLFFGSFIKLKTEMRKKLRKYLDWPRFESCIKNQYGSDELILHYLFWKSRLLEGKPFNKICMRRDGASLGDIHVRNYDRFDRKFANQPEDSDPDASLIHFCADRKLLLKDFICKIHGENIL